MLYDKVTSLSKASGSPQPIRAEFPGGSSSASETSIHVDAIVRLNPAYRRQYD